jgi:hypothetical protein
MAAPLSIGDFSWMHLSVKALRRDYHDVRARVSVLLTQMATADRVAISSALTASARSFGTWQVPAAR